jgi:hypothetical protein
MNGVGIIRESKWFEAAVDNDFAGRPVCLYPDVGALPFHAHVAVLEVSGFEQEARITRAAQGDIAVERAR